VTWWRDERGRTAATALTLTRQATVEVHPIWRLLPEASGPAADDEVR